MLKRWRLLFAGLLAVLGVSMFHGTEIAIADYHHSLYKREIFEGFWQTAFEILISGGPFFVLLGLFCFCFPKDLKTISPEKRYMWVGGLVIITLPTIGLSMAGHIKFWDLRIPYCVHCHALDGLLIIGGGLGGLIAGGMLMGLYLLVIKTVFYFLKLLNPAK